MRRTSPPNSVMRLDIHCEFGSLISQITSSFPIAKISTGTSFITPPCPPAQVAEASICLFGTAGSYSCLAKTQTPTRPLHLIRPTTPVHEHLTPRRNRGVDEIVCQLLPSSEDV